ncbi:disulfide isomerase [Ophiostoma piceae UAMH 11346]|uniref:protein disulfide-isomerase n=1 Tax=Ophiostoma piceae (strain UAMH 11346) TaxID=1262450 RepID=S3D7V3_OPHP1|nr:disulfide isomerase [Ophiostoma piceae UAMH 11346]
MTVSCWALLLAGLALSQGQGANAMYSSKSDVLQLNAKNFNQVIMQSNHTSMVEFYAPWCGHCKNLKVDYDKAATSLKGVANVAAIDCDAAENKQLCGSMGVQSFPTLKTFRPGKKSGRPVIEDYQGQRKAKAIVDAILPKINNHVAKVADDSLDGFLSTDADKPHVLLFTDKGKTGPVLRAIAIDYLDVISVGQIRDKETAAVTKFDIDKFPTLLLFPAGEISTPIKYDGELKKDAVMQFLRQVAEPNKPAEKKAKAKKAKKEAKGAKKDKAETESKTASTPTEQQTAPVVVEGPLPVPTLHTPEKLVKSCLHEKAGTCILALVSGSDEDASTKAALESLSELTYKYAKSKRHLFPVFVVPESNAASANIQDALQIKDKSSSPVTLVAVNNRRGWWRPYSEGGDMSHAAIENWIDSIRMSEGVTSKLPQTFLSAVSVNTVAKTEAAAEATAEAEVKHEEL